ncbi:MAG: hypothetical protein Q3979_04015 [Actinomycetaceae bacterium]|nr:hypothetical protein [Actinomycetaceae bacterium]
MKDKPSPGKEKAQILRAMLRIAQIQALTLAIATLALLIATVK